MLQSKKRLKQLSAIAAAAVAVALVGVSYGAWAVASSNAAVEEATAGAAGVLVAASDIAAGDVIGGDSLVVREVPQAYRADGALDAAALSGDGAIVGSRALVDIPAGTQILASLATGQADGDHLASQVSSGMEAVALSVDVETGIAGQIRSFDWVRVVSAESSTTDSSYLTTLCESVRVLSVGTTDAEGAAYTSVTVEVTPDEADAIRAAQYAGAVSLMLVSSADALGDGADHG